MRRVLYRPRVGAFRLPHCSRGERWSYAGAVILFGVSEVAEAKIGRDAGSCLRRWATDLVKGFSDGEAEVWDAARQPARPG